MRLALEAALSICRDAKALFGESEKLFWTLYKVRLEVTW